MKKKIPYKYKTKEESIIKYAVGEIWGGLYMGGIIVGLLLLGYFLIKILSRFFS